MSIRYKDIKELSPSILLGEFKGCEYIVHAHIVDLKCGGYKNGFDGEEEYYKITGDMLALGPKGDYKSSVMFISEKMYNLIKAFKEFEDGHLYIKFKIKIKRSKQGCVNCKYTLMHHSYG